MTLVERWDKGLAVRLPVAIVEALGLNDGDHVDIRLADDGGIVIRRDRARATALVRLRTLRRRLPAGFVFKRDDAYAG